jgi:hypothetical protein
METQTRWQYAFRRSLALANSWASIIGASAIALILRLTGWPLELPDGFEGVLYGGVMCLVAAWLLVLLWRLTFGYRIHKYLQRHYGTLGAFLRMRGLISMLIFIGIGALFGMLGGYLVWLAAQHRTPREVAVFQLQYLREALAAVNADNAESDRLWQELRYAKNAQLTLEMTGIRLARARQYAERFNRNDPPPSHDSIPDPNTREAPGEDAITDFPDKVRYRSNYWYYQLNRAYMNRAVDYLNDQIREWQYEIDTLGRINKRPGRST